MQNYAFCNNCKEIVAAERLERDNKVYLRKNCPNCGPNEHLISSDARLYNKKRDFMEDLETAPCRLDCPDCVKHKKPDIIFIDTTNRCNMNCHICLNNVAAMGFKYEPRMDFFEKIFKHYSAYETKPYVQLFGGEPTVRGDLFDIIKLGKSYGLSMRVVTNGLNLADENYCGELIKLGVMIHIAFDGSNKEMYEKLRGRADALDLKLKALKNLAAHKRGKVILMTVVDKESNRAQMPEILKVSFDNLHVIRGIYFMPLIHMWDEQALDYNPERTTLEDVELMVNEAVAGGNVEFVPLGSLFLKNLYKIFGIKNMPFVGVHPNCESITYLVSDGREFVSFSNFLKTSLYSVIGDLRALEKYVCGRYQYGKVNIPGKIYLYIRLFFLLKRHIDFGSVVGAKGLGAFMKWMGIIGKIALGRKPKDVIKSDTLLKGILQVLILPFEDYKTTESERLSTCSSCFVYVDPDTEKIKTLPICTWDKYKKPVMEEVAKKFNV